MRGENWSTREKNHSVESIVPTNPTHLWGRGRNRTQNTLMEGEFSQHFANLAPHRAPFSLLCTTPQLISAPFRLLVSVRWLGWGGVGWGQWKTWEGVIVLILHFQPDFNPFRTTRDIFLLNFQRWCPSQDGQSDKHQGIISEETRGDEKENQTDEPRRQHLWHWLVVSTFRCENRK